MLKELLITNCGRNAKRMVRIFQLYQRLTLIIPENQWESQLKSFKYGSGLSEIVYTEKGQIHSRKHRTGPHEHSMPWFLFDEKIFDED